MRRQAVLLIVLGAVVVLVVYYMFLYSPRSKEIATIRESIETVEGEQAVLRTRISQLEDVRARAPEIEARIAAAEAIIPREVALPSALRQLQLAADESGVSLVNVSPSRPTLDEGAVVASIALNVQLQGGYFQAVDFLRRVEDPSITPRGIVWSTASLALAEYPTLEIALTGEMFAVLPVVAPPPPEPTATDAPEETG